MQRQLADIVKGFEGAQARLDKLGENIPDAAWEERTEPGHWSVGQKTTAVVSEWKLAY
ncbi:MAG TPA: hypothetical protein VM053_02710 [Gemmatimonadaceae bacterium]|nr:hypothetical protein [Gemmatimonadaceae bacterium]